MSSSIIKGIFVPTNATALQIGDARGAIAHARRRCARQIRKVRRIARQRARKSYDEHARRGYEEGVLRSIRDISAHVESFATEREKVVAAASQECLEIALRVIEETAGEPTVQTRDAIQFRINQSLRDFGESQRIDITLSPHDFNLIQGEVFLDQPRWVTLYSDHTINNGEIQLSAASGRAVYSLQHQVREISEFLRRTLVEPRP